MWSKKCLNEVKRKKIGEVSMQDKAKMMDYNFMSKNGMCTGKNEKPKVKIPKNQTILH